MAPATVFDLVHQALVLVLMLSLPAVLTAGVVGLLIGLVQAVTQIQDQSMSQAVKLVAVLAVCMLFGNWMGIQLLSFGENLFRNFAVFTR
jgi:type III secretion protein S